MDPISFAASIAAIIGVTAKTIQCLVDVKNAPSERQALSREATDLLQLLVRLNNLTEQQAGCWNDSLKLLATEHGALEQLRESLEKVAQKLKPRAGIKKVVRTLAWTLDKKECDEALKKIERVKSRISLALEDDIYKLTLAIKADTAGIDTINERVSQLHVTEEAKHRQQILDWFSPLNFYKAQQDILKRREEGTGKWLIEDTPAFQDWLDGSNRTLCCAGIPGAGKSVLASIVVDYLRHRASVGHGYGVAAAYCNFKERDMQSTENLIAGLCVQLIDSSSPIPETLAKLWESHQPKQTRPTLMEIISVIAEVGERQNKCYLIIDALDECPSEVRDVLVPELKALQSNIVFLVTTRHIDSVTRVLDADSFVEVLADPGDLKKYIMSRFASSSRLSSLLKKQAVLAEKACAKIIEKADGMFLAAKLHVDSLATKMSISMIKKALDNLPKTLDDLYHDVFCRIDAQPEDERNVANRALRWVAYAYRPLSTKELGEALAIEPGAEDFDPDAIPETKLVLETCAGLVIVDEETELVRLVHYTAQDYLDKLLSSRFAEAHASIAGDCITYMSYKIFQSYEFEREDEYESQVESETEVEPESEIESESQSESGDDQTALECHLLNYAVKFWPHHYTKDDKPSLQAQLYHFLTTKPRVWLEVGYDEWVVSPKQLHRCSGIGVAAYSGLHNALRLLLQDEVNINEATYKGYSVLHLAAAGGSVRAIEILLDHGADIESRDSSEETPLHQAIWHENEEAACTLLKRGASAVALDKNGSSPFSVVSWDSPISFLQQLLNHGVDINAESHSRAQLPMRAWKGDMKTVRWLLEQGASPNCNGGGPAALHHASYRGYIEIAKLLLDGGACVNIKDNDGRTPLHGANSVEMVELLLKHGAAPSEVDNWGQNVLHLACRGGKAPIVKRCLQIGIDIDSATFWGETPLHIVARDGHSEVLEILLTNNAEVDKQDKDGHTPLMNAFKNYYSYRSNSIVIHSREPASISMIRALVNASSKIDIRDNFGWNILHYAAAKGNIVILREISIHHVIAPLARSRLALTAKLRNEEMLWSPHADPGMTIETNECAFEFYNTQQSQDWRLNLDEDYERWKKYKNDLVLEYRSWKGGMTALDIAILCNHEDCIQYLEPLVGVRTESIVLSFDDFLCELYGFSSIEELEEEVDKVKKANANLPDTSTSRE